MKLVMFSKILKDLSLEELVEFAKETGLDGFDLCVRPGYPVNPENAAEALPQAAELFKKNGLSIPMVTGNFDLLEPSHPTAEPILKAMGKAGIRLLKLGYFHPGNKEIDYWKEVERIRGIFESWYPFCRENKVKVCYHTHSNKYMGMNAGMLAHLLRGLDPECIGAYLDPGHLLIDGEDFQFALMMVREYMSILAVKDFLIVREELNGHGKKVRRDLPSGEGLVNWTLVFEELKKINYDGPVSIHAEYPMDNREVKIEVTREAAFFRRFIG